MKKGNSYKLKIPVGNIVVYFDGIPQHTEWQKLQDYNEHNKVDSRLCFKFNYQKDNKTHSLKCVIEDCTLDSKPEFESGENLVALSIYLGDFGLTVGAEGEEIEECNLFYDYGLTVLPNGLQYDIRTNTKSQIFIFGLAWVFDYKKTGEDDVRTWLAADPAAFKG